jgi:FKBP-type peptidyl-prolyl cis-trans isomerase
MAKHGIKIISDTPGTGAALCRGDKVRIRYSIQLNRGDFLAEDQVVTLTIGDRENVAGFRYGLEGMRVGGTRQFKASPHLCYRDLQVGAVPPNAVLIFDITQVELLSRQTLHFLGVRNACNTRASYPA